MTHDDDNTLKSPRRTFLKVAGIGAVGLVACGDDDALGDGGVRTDAGRLPDGALPDAPLPDGELPDVAADAGPVVDDGLVPMLSGWHILQAQSSRVYFESSEAIQASDTTGFFVSHRETTGVTINGRSLTGHYFTVDTPFDYWDNDTIRYEGGSDMQDLHDNPVYPFTLSYIENRMDEPAADTLRYVSRDASGAGDGTSEGSAWTLSQAFESAEAGMTVWIKAGNYGNQELGLSLSGTASEPIKFVGYKDAPGDIISNYFDYDVTWDTAEMPTLTGSSAEDGHAIQLYGAHYVILRNLQITNYYMGIRANGTHNSHLVFDRLNGNFFGDENINASFITMSTLVPGEDFYRPFTSNGYMRSTDCRCINANMAAVAFFGEGSCLVDGFKSYTDRTGVNTVQDYHIGLNGHHSIIRRCYCENFNSVTRETSHGIGIRGSSNLSNNYNLIEKSTAVNVLEGFYVRNFGCEYNVIKDCVFRNNDNAPNYVTRENTGAVVIWGGSNFNIVERVEVYTSSLGILFTDNQEEGNTDDTTIGHDNVIRNCIFNKTKYSVAVSGGGHNALLENNQIIGCTFNDSYYVVENINQDADIRNLQFIGCIITNHIGAPMPLLADGVSFTNCAFYGNRDDWWVEGDGNVHLDPMYVSDTDLHLTAESPVEITQGGGDVAAVLEFDMDGNKRSGPVSMGAYEWRDPSA